MTSHRITLVVVPFLLALATSAQVQPPPPQESVDPVQVLPNQEGVSDEEVPEVGPASPMSFAEVMPTFPGGEEAYKNYLMKNIVYPASAREAGIQGKVFVQFVVEADGSITQVKALRGVPGAPEMDHEAVRVVKAMPRWKPGKNLGEPVAVLMTVPIAFRLHEEAPAGR